MVYYYFFNGSEAFPWFLQLESIISFKGIKGICGLYKVDIKIERFWKFNFVKKRKMPINLIQTQMTSSTVNKVHYDLLCKKVH